jgi:LysM repeat protein
MKTVAFCSVLLVLCVFSYVPITQAAPARFGRTSVVDSVGIEKKDGKRYILHRVDEGQTLYAIARRYGRSVADIKAANPDMKEAVKYDQLVRIPIPDGALSKKEEKAVDKAIRKQEKAEKREAKATEKATSPDKPVAASTDKKQEKEPAKTDDPAQAGIHVVAAGETLFSLANRYGVLQADLRKWNNLSGNNVLIGQALIVSEKAYQARTPSNPTPNTPAKSVDTSNRHTKPHTSEPRIAEPRSTTPSESKPPRRTEPPRNESDGITASTERPTDTKSGDAKSADGKSAEVEIELPRPGNDAPMPTAGRRVSASGVAEMIEGADGSGKYLALHRTAPIGTLVQVRNEFNNQSLWVKVIGRLPNTGVNDKILVKLSTQAFSKLSPQDRRFRAEVSYIVR